MLKYTLIFFKKKKKERNNLGFIKISFIFIDECIRNSKSDNSFLCHILILKLINASINIYTILI
jgi:hypothetical protein